MKIDPFEEIQMSNFIKICPMAAELFHAERQTDITRPIAASRNFANASQETSRVENVLFLSPQSKPYFLLRKNAPYSNVGIVQQSRDTYTAAYDFARTSLL
jgi:hypothetical protein